MAGYGYSNRGYTAYNGMETPRTEGWSKTSYAGDGINTDHVCRPVIIDAEGRKHPIISYSTPNHNTESYVAKSETIVEHVQIPMATEYKYKVETSPEYGYSNNKWGTPTSPVYDRPQKVEEFVTKVQTEVSRPTRPTVGAPVGSTYWRQSPTSTGYGVPTGHGYSDNYDYSNKEWNKPGNNTIRNDDFNGYNRRDETLVEPVPKTGGWSSRPNRVSWATPPASYETPLSKPTTDIGAAVEYLKEVATKPSAVAAALPTAALPQPRFTVTVPRRDGYGDSMIDSRPKRESYTDAIDSREAARRYGNFNVSSRPYGTVGDSYGPSIDSREATRRYNGTNV